MRMLVPLVLAVAAAAGAADPPAPPAPATSADPGCGAEGPPGPDLVLVDGLPDSGAGPDGFVRVGLGEGPGWTLGLRRGGWFGRSLEVRLAGPGGFTGPVLAFRTDGARTVATPAGSFLIRARHVERSGQLEVYGPEDGLPASFALAGLVEDPDGRPIDRPLPRPLGSRSREGFLVARVGVVDRSPAPGGATVSKDRVVWGGGRFELHRYYFPEGGSFDEAGFLLIDRVRRTWGTVHWFYTAGSFEAAGVLDRDHLVLFRDRASLEVDPEGLRAFPLAAHLEGFRLGPEGLVPVALPEAELSAALTAWLGREAATGHREASGMTRVTVVPSSLRPAGAGLVLGLDLELTRPGRIQLERHRARARIEGGALRGFEVGPDPGLEVLDE